MQRAGRWALFLDFMISVMSFFHACLPDMKKIDMNSTLWQLSDVLPEEVYKEAIE